MRTLHFSILLAEYRFVNYLLYFLAIISLSQAGNLARYAAAPPEMIGFWRLLGASLVMLIFAATHQNQVRFYKELNSKNIFFLFLSGFFFFTHLWTYKFSVQNTTIANAMIIYATNPLFTALLTVCFMGEKFEKRYLASYLLAFLGIYLLLEHNLQMHSKNIGGDIAAIFAALFYSLFIIFGKKARHAMSNPTYTFFVYGLASFCFFAFSQWKETQLLDYPTHTWVSILLLILFPTLLGHTIFSYLLKKLNINWMSTGKLLEPILAILGAYFFFEEKLSPQASLAFILTAFSIVILIAPYRLKEDSHKPPAKSP